MASVDEPMDRRIARLALARFRVGGFVGTSIADLAGALGVSKAAIYYHYRSKDALLHHLVFIPSWTPSTPASRTTTSRGGRPGRC